MCKNVRYIYIYIYTRTKSEKETGQITKCKEVRCTLYNPNQIHKTRNISKAVWDIGCDFSPRKLEGHPGKPARSLNSGWASQILFLPVVMDVGWTATSQWFFVKRSVMSWMFHPGASHGWKESFQQNSSYHSWWAVDRKLPKFTHEKNIWNER